MCQVGEETALSYFLCLFVRIACLLDSSILFMGKCEVRRQVLESHSEYLYELTLVLVYMAHLFATLLLICQLLDIFSNFFLSLAVYLHD